MDMSNKVRYKILGDKKLYQNSKYDWGPLKVDRATTQKEILQFARILVELSPN